MSRTITLCIAHDHYSEISESLFLVLLLLLLLLLPTTSITTTTTVLLVLVLLLLLLLLLLLRSQPDHSSQLSRSLCFHYLITKYFELSNGWLLAGGLTLERLIGT